MTAKRAMIITVAVLFVLIVAWVLLQVRGILLILILAITLSAAIAPLVSRMRRIGLSQGQSVLVIYIALLLLVGGVGFVVVPSLVSQAGELNDSIPGRLADLRRQASSSDSEFLNTTGVRIIDRVTLAYEERQRDPEIDGSTIFRYGTTAANAIFGAFTLFVITYYWTTERAVIKRLILGRVALQRRDRVYRLWDEIELKLGGWVRGQLALSAIIGVASAVGYYALGLDFWLALGIMAGVLGVIPFLGAVLAGGAAVLVALTVSPLTAVLTLVFVLVLQQLESAVLVPRIMRNAVGLSPLSVILAVLVGGAILGPLGAIVAIPVGAAVQVLVQDLLEARDEVPVGDSAPAETSAEAVSPPPLRDPRTTNSVNDGRN